MQPGRVVAQLDADHRPAPTYLREIVRAFADPRVGYVAAPSVCDANAGESWAARGRLYKEATFHGPQQAGATRDPADVHRIALRRAHAGAAGDRRRRPRARRGLQHLAHDERVRLERRLRARRRGARRRPDTFADFITQEFQWARSLMIVLFGLVPGHLRRMRGILRTRFAFALAYYPITAAVLTGGQLLGPVAVLTGVPWVHVSYPAFVLHMTAVSMWLLFGILLLRRRGLMRPAEAPVFTWENALFMLTRWPYVVRGVWAGIIGDPAQTGDLQGDAQGHRRDARAADEADGAVRRVEHAPVRDRHLRRTRQPRHRLRLPVHRERALLRRGERRGPAPAHARSRPLRRPAQVLGPRGCR